MTKTSNLLIGHSERVKAAAEEHAGTHYSIEESTILAFNKPNLGQWQCAADVAHAALMDAFLKLPAGTENRPAVVIDARGPLDELLPFLNSLDETEEERL